MINFIKSRGKNSRLFTVLCKNMDSDFQTLLLHTEIRWLSKGKCLQRFLSLRNEVKIFLVEHNPDMAQNLNNKRWMLKLSYLSDIFEKLNELNLSLQGKASTIFTLRSKIGGFLAKLDIWRKRVQDGSYEMFSTTEDYLVENGEQNWNFKKLVLNHLMRLKENLQERFSVELDSTVSLEYNWIINPYGHTDPNNLSLKAQEELADLSTDSFLKIEFERKSLANFWLDRAAEFPSLSQLATNVLLPFVSTYLCEAAFSTMTHIKSSNRSRLEDLESAMIPPLTTIEPRYDLIMRGMRFHPSH